MKRILLVTFFLAVISSCTVKPDDPSLSVEEYIQLGVPDPGKKWTMSDYSQARNALSLIKWKSPRHLPAKDSKKSGALFEHMLSLEYLSFLQDTALALHEKAMMVVEFARVYDYWIDIYEIPILKKNHYHREIIDIQLFNVSLKESMLHLANQLNESDDPADIALQYGYKFIKENYLAVLNAGLKTQRRGTEFLKQDLDRMADSIYSSAMRNRKVLDSGEVAELLQSFRMVTDSTSSEYIRRKYTSIQKSLTGT